MRKIEKSCDLSIAYKTWVDAYEANGQLHEKYTSNGKYYGDVIMQLHRCQFGLCAYTELFLCSPKHFHDNHWINGRYSSPIPKIDRRGTLEHFDPALKKSKGWLWENFFIVDYETNSSIVKGAKKIDAILKPDSDAYDPFVLLDYDAQEHQYLPNEELNNDEQKLRIRAMLSTLGIDKIPHIRRNYLRNKFSLIYYGAKTWDNVEITQFPTAFAMCRMKVENGEIALEDLISV
jgi:hypothetical protein